MKPEERYHYRGMIERGGPYHGYRWVEGWSPGEDGEVCYPWFTRREAQRQAKAEGRKAVFIREEIKP